MTEIKIYGKLFYPDNVELFKTQGWEAYTGTWRAINLDGVPISYGGKTGVTPIEEIWGSWPITLTATENIETIEGAKGKFFNWSVHRSYGDVGTNHNSSNLTITEPEPPRQDWVRFLIEYKVTELPPVAVCIESQFRCKEGWGNPPYTLQKCINNNWVTQTEYSTTCGYRPAECNEGETQVLEYCPDGVTPKTWNKCINGVWVDKSTTCPTMPVCRTDTDCLEGYRCEAGECVPIGIWPEIPWEWLAGIGIGTVIIGGLAYSMLKKKKRGSK